MKKTVRQLLREIDSAELTEWKAYSKLEPFGDELRSADYHTALIAAVVANAHRKPGTKQFSVDDFLLDREFKPKRIKQDPQELQKALIEAFQPVSGKKDRKLRRQVQKTHRARKAVADG